MGGGIISSILKAISLFLIAAGGKMLPPTLIPLSDYVFLNTALIFIDI